MNKSNNERYNTHDAETVLICVLFSKFTFYPSSSLVHSFLLLNKCGAYALPHRPPHQPHHHPRMQSSCLNVCVSVCASGFSVCVCVCAFMFLTVCCRHLEPSKKRNIAEVCFGKSKRKLTAEGGGKLKRFFSLSLLWFHWVSLITLLVQFWLHAEGEGIPLQCRL